MVAQGPREEAMDLLREVFGDERAEAIAVAVIPEAPEASAPPETPAPSDTPETPEEGGTGDGPEPDGDPQGRLLEPRGTPARPGGLLPRNLARSELRRIPGLNGRGMRRVPSTGSSVAVSSAAT